MICKPKTNWWLPGSTPIRGNSDLEWGFILGVMKIFWNQLEVVVARIFVAALNATELLTLQ